MSGPSASAEDTISAAKETPVVRLSNLAMARSEIQPLGSVCRGCTPVLTSQRLFE